MMVSDFFSMIFFPVLQTGNSTFQNWWSVSLTSAGQYASKTKLNILFEKASRSELTLDFSFQNWKKTNPETSELFIPSKF